MSSALRDSMIDKLDDGDFEVFVAGAGINGAVSAAALAARGASVAVVDAGDFAGHTSSQSSNLAWGGIKYLESREFLPLGATQPQQVDVRLIFATNVNLSDKVQAGTFREDFYYRIFVYPILMPPLRQRRDDILPIADQITQRDQWNPDRPQEIRSNFRL